MLRIILRSSLAAALLLAVGCHYDRDAESGGALQTDSRSVELGTAESVHVDVKMGAGNLNITGGAQKLLEAEFQYNRPSRKPEVKYDVSGLRGTLTIRQPEGTTMNTGKTKNQWDLKFNNNARIDVSVFLGAGEGRLEMGSLSLRGLDVEMGAGELRLDLRGAPKRSYDVRVRGGVGDANIYLPSKVGIIADLKGGIGSISTRGLEKQGDAWVNSAYDKSETTIRLDVKGGVGAINLISE
jgi:uncharacterized protein DUF2154